MKKSLIILAFSALLLSACTPMEATRGNLVSNTQFQEVEAQKSTRADVLHAWGPPTATSSFDQNTWYYIGETTAQKGIFAPEVEKRRVIRVRFDPAGTDRVVEVADMDTTKAKDVDIVSRTTPTAGKDYTFVQQFIGNLGKYNGASDDKK